MKSVTENQEKREKNIENRKKIFIFAPPFRETRGQEFGRVSARPLLSTHLKQYNHVFRFCKERRNLRKVW